MGPKKYKVGDIIGPYTIVAETDDSRKVVCRCNNCGSIVTVFKGTATRNRMCRYCRTEFNRHPRDDLTGMKFGRLTVFGNKIMPNGRQGWECLCDCGNIVVVETSHLTDGHTKSCGCFMKERTSQANLIDLIGMRFGNLVAVERMEDHITKGGYPLTQYLCECDCGNIKPVLAMNLVSGNTKSCGCIGNSNGEYEVNKRLLENDVIFQRQYSFRDCVSENGWPLRFDFGLLNNDKSVNCIVEFNGEQHYYDEDRKTDFGKLQRESTDAIKKRYCLEHNIQLFIIRFDDNIDKEIHSILEYYKQYLK